MPGRPPIVVDVTDAARGIPLKLSRGTIDRSEPCVICHCLTNRVLAHKLSIDPTWSTIIWCDFCFMNTFRLYEKIVTSENLSTIAQKDG